MWRCQSEAPHRRLPWESKASSAWEDHESRVQRFSAWWLPPPIWKILYRQNGNLPHNRDENKKKMFETTTQFFSWLKMLHVFDIIKMKHPHGGLLRFGVCFNNKSTKIRFRKIEDWPDQSLLVVSLVILTARKVLSFTWGFSRSYRICNQKTRFCWASPSLQWNTVLLEATKKRKLYSHSHLTGWSIGNSHIEYDITP